MDLNQVIIVGRLGRDAEMKTTQGGQNYTRFSVATSKSWKDKQDQWQKQTTWHNVICWGKTAEAAGQLKKGGACMVQGMIEMRKYTGKDGTEKTSFEIKADIVMAMAETKKKDDQGPPDAMSTDINGVPYTEDNIPF